MTVIVNLRRVRKQKAREAAEGAAAANRNLHGIAKSTRQAAKVQNSKQSRDLDARFLKSRDTKGD